MLLSLTACKGSEAAEESASQELDTAAIISDYEYIEYTLNLANNENQEWSYSENADAWGLPIVSTVAYPKIENQQGVSACVPGAYVTGIDADGDGTADITADAYMETVKGALVIDYGQEDYVFGSSEQDARHWNKFLLEIFEEYAEVLEPLFSTAQN